MRGWPRRAWRWATAVVGHANGRRARGRRRARRLRRPGARLADRSRSRPRVVRRGVRRLLEHGCGLSRGRCSRAHRWRHSSSAGSSISAARSSSRRSPRCSSRARCSSTRARRSSSGPAPRCSSRSRSLLYPGYGALFHELASEIVFAAGFAVWTALAVRAALTPTAWRFAALGAATALIALTRPVNQAFLVVAILPLALAGSWRARLGRTIAFVGVAAVLLGAWAGDEPLALRRPRGRPRRAGELPVLPRVHRRSDRRARERRGVAGAGRPRRARAPAEGAVPLVRRRPRDVLRARQPAPARGPDRPLRPAVRLGLGLRAPGSRRPRERARPPGRRSRGTSSASSGRSSRSRSSPVVSTSLQRSRPHPAGAGLRPRPALPEPTEGEVVPSEHQSAQLSTPDGSIREVWTSPTEHVLEFDDPAKRARWLANDRREAELFAAFPDRWSSPWLGLQLDRSSKLYPPLWSWLLVGVVARRDPAPVALVGDARAGRRRARDAARDGDDRLGRARLRGARRARVRAPRGRRDSSASAGRARRARAGSRAAARCARAGRPVSGTPRSLT